MRNTKTSCKLSAAALGLAISIMLTACGAPGTTAAAADENKLQKQVYAMDTVMILTAYGENAETALDHAEQTIYALEDDLDPENPEGSVWALNAGAGSSVAISDDCYNVMSTTMSVYYASGGALDPGLYPLVKAWGFISGEYRVPDPQEINALLSAKNTGMIQLDGAACSAEIPAGMEVSFGAVGKGYTAQKVVDGLAADGVTCAILSLGGNVQTLGQAKPDGSLWQVAVTDPYDTGSYVGVLHLGQAAVVTSGGYQRYFEQDGVTYIHIIDPETGYPVDNDLLSVTVVTDDGAEADALSTTLFVLGLDGALDYYEDNGGFELVVITQDNHVIVTPGLVDCFEEYGEDYTYEYLG